MTAQISMINAKAGEPVMLSTQAWIELDRFAPDAVSALLLKTCQAGYWESLSNAAAAGCMHGDSLGSRLTTVLDALIEDPAAEAAGRLWINELAIGAANTSGQRIPQRFIPDLFNRELQRVGTSAGRGTLIATRMLVESGAEGNEKTVAALTKAGALEPLQVLLDSWGVDGTKRRSSEDAGTSKLSARGLTQIIMDALSSSDAAVIGCAQVLVGRYEWLHADLFDEISENVIRAYPDSARDSTRTEQTAALMLIGLAPRGSDEQRAHQWSLLEQSGFAARLPFTQFGADQAKTLLALMRNEAGFDINGHDEGGSSTMLHLAAGAGASPWVDALLSEGADATIRAGGNARTAADVALENGHLEIASLLNASLARNAFSNIAKARRLAMS